MAPTKLGNYVKARREELDLTQAGLAERIGNVTGQAIYAIEVGKTVIPTPAVMAGLARVLDVPEITLLQLAGYLQDVTVAPGSWGEAQAEIHRIAAMPDYGAKLDALMTLSPEMFDLMESIVYARLERAAQMRDR